MAVSFRRAHAPGDAGREINDLPLAFLRNGGNADPGSSGRHVFVPKRQGAAREFAEAAGHGAKEFRAEDGPKAIEALQATAERRGDTGHMAGQPHRPLLTARRVALVPQFLDEFAGIGPDGAVQVAERVGGAGLVARIFVKLLHLGGAVRLFAGGTQALDLAERRHALARRQREPFGHAIAFAETAFHTFVHDLFRGRAGLQVRDVRHRVGVQDDARVEDALRVEQGLDPLHQFIGLFAPFILHERSHVAARAVFGFQ